MCYELEIYKVLRNVLESQSALPSALTPYVLERKLQKQRNNMRISGLTTNIPTIRTSACASAMCDERKSLGFT